MIYFNNLSAFTEVHYGNTNIAEVYFGNNKVWPISTPPPQPTSAITYTASDKLNVNMHRFNPTATDEIFDNGFGIIEFDSDVLLIGGYAFENYTGLYSVDIPNSVTKIGWCGFSGCTSLTSVTIPSGVTSINYKAFYGCRGLTSITVEATIPPSLDDYVFGNTNNCPIYVPSGSVNAYKSAWPNYSSRIRAIP